jgi:hypothetical protein
VSFVDIARSLVVRTNDWPALKNLYLEAYELGLSFSTSRLKSLPDVLAVLLRVAEGGRTWVPGLSDYDLTVLTERCDATQMTRILEAVWKRYRRIKRSMPQLGEMEVMDVEEYGDFLSFGPPPTSSLKRADPLFVRPDRLDLQRVLQRRPRASQEREFLLDALSRYIRFLFPAWLDHASGAANVAQRRRAEHLLGNVGKRLQRLAIPAPTGPGGTFADRIVQSFQDLSRVCSRIHLGGDEAATVVCAGTWSAAAGEIPFIEKISSHALRQAKVRDCCVILWMSYMSADKLSLVFVIPDETPGHELRNLVATLGTLHRNSEGLWKSAFSNGQLQAYFPSLAYPVVVSRSMWECWRELSPFDGAAVAANGRTLMGSDDSLRAVPSVAALKRGAEVQYAALLPLKNNWRPLRGTGTPNLYASMMNYVKGYASAVSGTVLTSPTRYTFTSTREGYQAVSAELAVLRQTLSS